MREVYLDYAATAPVDRQVAKKVDEIFADVYGNPSSMHTAGRKAKGYVEKARESIASYIGAEPNEIYFTSGGTESDNWALKGVVEATEQNRPHIITSVIEHHAILHTCEYLEKKGCGVTYLGVDAKGMVKADDVEKAIRPETVLISIMTANNEIGTIQPVAQIGKIAKKHNVLFHSDAVQALGSVKIDVDEMNVDMLSFSAHKIYGPKGVGAMYIRKGTQIANFMHGGAQELSRRAGTHNVPSIAGFGEAVDMLKEKDAQYVAHYRQIREYLYEQITKKIEYVILNGHEQNRLPNNLNISIGYVEGEALLINLDMEGIYVSTGSACSSGSLEPSHVLNALHVEDEFIHGTMRLTIGRHTTREDADYTAQKIKEVVDRLRAMSPLYKDRRK